MFIGDFNLNMLKGEDDPEVPNKKLPDFCDQFCSTNMSNESTRVTNCSKTLMDVILVSHVERYAAGGALHLGISDHDLAYIIRKQRLSKAKAKCIEFRSTKYFDENSFTSYLSNAPWDTTYIYIYI